MEKIPSQTKFSGKRVALVGPSCTGKSTLSRKLAQHYYTSFSEEYAREYAIHQARALHYDDVIPIAKGQRKLEALADDNSNGGLVFYDTNLWQTACYSEIYYGKCPPLLFEACLHSSYDLYLLMNIDLEWVNDDVRDASEERMAFYEHFKKSLTKFDSSFVEIKGTSMNRIETAISAINQLTK
jgi:NadR type nicotinamide-nucleotide adenylyltransferase